MIAMGRVDPVVKAVGIVADKFASIDAIGPSSVALYPRVPLRSPQADRVQALAFARVDQLLRRLRRESPEVTPRIARRLPTLPGRHIGQPREARPLSSVGRAQALALGEAAIGVDLVKEALVERETGGHGGLARVAAGVEHVGGHPGAHYTLARGQRLASHGMVSARRSPSTITRRRPVPGEASERRARRR